MGREGGGGGGGGGMNWIFEATSYCCLEVMVGQGSAPTEPIFSLCNALQILVKPLTSKFSLHFFLVSICTSYTF